MKNLLLSSCLILLIYGCSRGHYNRLTPLVASAEIPPLKPIFGDHFNSFLFKTNIRMYGKNFSGLLVTKQIRPSDYRIIFTTELGMKLFDFEFTDSAFILHYCVPQFNRPALIKTIQQDIAILLMNNIASQPLNHYSDPEDHYFISEIKEGVFSNYYFQEKSNAHLVN